jgi:RHS repeat-associated protein
LRRRIRKEYTWLNSAWVLSAEVRYVYDGKLVIQERNANNVPLVSYTRGRDLSGSLEAAGGIGGMLARTENWRLNTDAASAHAYYHADGSGNITILSDANQKSAARYLFDPFGNTASSTGPLADGNCYRFSSKEYHSASGLLYYLWRHYDPNLQRWVNRDPINESESRSGARYPKAFDWKEEKNLYCFVHNDPVAGVDAFGLLTFSGCTDEQKDNLQKQFDEGCNDIKKPQFRTCLCHFNIPGRLASNCDNSDGLTVACHQNNDGACFPGRCGYTRFLGSTINVCPDGLSGGANCPPYKCILMHELTHIIGHTGETWPDHVTACMSFDCPPFQD